MLLSRDGRTRLVDFGIAHSLATTAERLTLAGTVIGTLHAMAPEQLSGGPITPRTDLYGLGVVLHEALFARPPYAATSPVALADAQRAGPPALDGIDPALAAVIAGCLAFDPADRPLHAGALATALRSWLAGDPAPALALGPAAAAGRTRPHARWPPPRWPLPRRRSRAAGRRPAPDAARAPWRPSPRSWCWRIVAFDRADAERGSRGGHRRDAVAARLTPAPDNARAGRRRVAAGR